MTRILHADTMLLIPEAQSGGTYVALLMFVNDRRTHGCR